MNLSVLKDLRIDHELWESIICPMAFAGTHAPERGDGDNSIVAYGPVLTKNVLPGMKRIDS